MIDHQIHFERKFYQDKKTGYWISTDHPRIRAHQWIWIKIHGVIPKGYHIHHKNENKSDNRIENLELIERSRHMSHHMSQPERKEKSRKNLEKIRFKASAWHKSEEGRAWHRLHAIQMNLGNGEYFKYECKQCFKSYTSKIKAKDRSRFCSNACKSKWRRKNKIDDIDKICPVCEKKYRSSKYSRAKTCSRICGTGL